MQIPIVILNWNGADDTIPCVESVLLQTYTDFHIYLIDNNSAAGDRQKLIDVYGGNSKITMLFNTNNEGFTKAHNRCFEQHILPHGYQVVALLNNDTIADRHWLEKGIEAMSNFGADVIACKMLNFYNPKLLDSAGLYMLNTGEILPRGHGHDQNSYIENEPVISFCAGACFIKTAMLRQHGVFDPFFGTGYEDAELGLRYFIAGASILFEPSSIVKHKMSRSIYKVANRDKAIKTQRDIHYTVLKLLPFSVLFWNLPVYILRMLLLLLLHLFTLRVAYVSMWFSSVRLLFANDIKYINRKNIAKKRGFWGIIAMQKNFIAKDMQRFIAFFIRKESNYFEKMDEQNK